MHSHRLLITLLALLCVTLASVAASELIGGDTSPPEPSPPGAIAPPKSERAAANTASFSLAALDRFSSVTERPLFSPTRRPSARAADGSGAWSSFALAGIIITSQSREVLVVHGKPPSVAHLTEGQAVEGWTLRAIYPDHVVFGDQFNEHELKLIDKTAPSSASAPRPPPRRAAP